MDLKLTRSRNFTSVLLVVHNCDGKLSPPPSTHTFLNAMLTLQSSLSLFFAESETAASLLSHFC